ncbi:hypothetical protein FSP39_006270 [Pinctada imbricata]|uniref:Uncharacterized protein n=1 Tax=Pinctada imbricata TaxID=66713 RepID=A0AA88Y7U9_PINIB|nr:hypothetical protein FSP39_006270 [Pinctada imbricata]
MKYHLRIYVFAAFKGTANHLHHSSSKVKSSTKSANLISTGFDNKRNKTGEVVAILDHPFNVNPDGSFSISANTNQNENKGPGVYEEVPYKNPSDVKNVNQNWAQQSVDKGFSHHKASNNYQISQINQINSYSEKPVGYEQTQHETNSNHQINPEYGFTQQTETSGSGHEIGTGFNEKYDVIQPIKVTGEQQNMDTKQFFPNIGNGKKEAQIWNTGFQTPSEQRKTDLNAPQTEAEMAHAKFLGLINPWGVGMFAKKGWLPPRGTKHFDGFEKRETVQSLGEQHMLPPNKQIETSKNTGIKSELNMNNHGNFSDYSSTYGVFTDPSTGHFDISRDIQNQDIPNGFDIQENRNSKKPNEYASKSKTTNKNKESNEGIHLKHPSENWISVSIPEDVFNGLKHLNDLLDPSQSIEGFHGNEPGTYNSHLLTEAVEHAQSIPGRKPDIQFSEFLKEMANSNHSYQLNEKEGMAHNAMDKDPLPRQNKPFEFLGSNGEINVQGENFIQGTNSGTNADTSMNLIDKQNMYRESIYPQDAPEIVKHVSTNIEPTPMPFKIHDPVQNGNNINANVQTQDVMNSGSGTMFHDPNARNIFSDTMFPHTSPAHPKSGIQHDHSTDKRIVDSVQDSPIMQYLNNGSDTTNNRNVPYGSENVHNTGIGPFDHEMNPKNRKYEYQYKHSESMDYAK